MSLTPRNIVVDGPDVASDLVFNVPADPSGFDASPIYTALSGTCTINGSYYGAVGTAYEDIEYIYSSVVMTPDSLARIPLKGEDLAPFLSEDNFEIARDHSDSSYADIGATSGIIPTGKFAAFCGLLTSITNRPTPFDPPLFEPDLNKEDMEAGTRRDHSVSPATDLPLGATVTIRAPVTTGSIEGGDLKLRFRLTVSMNAGYESYTEDMDHEVDASAWTSADFRDIRGTYGTTSADVNGIEYVWSLTIA